MIGAGLGPLDCPHLAKGGFDRSESSGMLYCDGGHLHSMRQRMAVLDKKQAKASRRIKETRT